MTRLSLYGNDSRRGNVRPAAITHNNIQNLSSLQNLKENQKEVFVNLHFLENDLLEEKQEKLIR